MKKTNITRLLFAIGAGVMIMTLGFPAGSVSLDFGNQANEVRITTLRQTSIPGNRYGIIFLFHNYKSEPINATSEHTLIYPDGQTQIVLVIDHDIVFPNEEGGAAIMCFYTTELNGKYTWVVTLRESHSYEILDEQSVSWIRGIYNISVGNES